MLGLLMLSVSKEKEELAKIVHKLGSFPLAIDQAGAYIQRLKIPLSNYLPLYDQNFQFVMNKKPPSALWHYRQDTVFTTWEVSYTAIAEQCPEANEILTVSSFFSNQNIPEILFAVLFDSSMSPGMQKSQSLCIRELCVSRRSLRTQHVCSS